MTTENVGTRDMNKSSTSLWALRVSLASAILFPILLLTLHTLNPELDPSWRVISEYAIGPNGRLMVLAFICLAVSCVALVVGIRSEIRSVAGYIGLLLLLLSAGGMVLAALFTTDPITTPPEARTPTGKLHELGAMLDVTPFAAALISWNLARRNPRWATVRRPLYWTAGLTWIALLAFFVTLGITLPANNGTFGPDVPIGWPNRLMVLTYCLWLSVVARRGIALAGGGVR